MDKQRTVSLQMIVKDETDVLRRCLESIAPHVDEIVVGLTSDNKETEVILREFGATIYPIKWEDDFAKARNQVLEKCTKDWTVWCDADDIWRRADSLRSIIARAADDIDVIRVPYAYEIEPKSYKASPNNYKLYATTLQWRERIVRNNGAAQWKGRVHETMCVIRNVGVSDTSEVWIDHFPPAKDNLERNLRILLDEYEKTKDSRDPRIVLYLGLTYYGIKDYENAERYFREYIPTSGWDEQKYTAHVYLGDIYRKTGQIVLAISQDLQAVELLPDYPDAYLGLAEDNFLLRKFNKTIYWINHGMRHKITSPTYDHNPRKYTILPLIMLAKAYVETNQIPEALGAATEIQRLEPGNPEAKEMVKILTEVNDDIGLSYSFVDVLTNLPDEQRKKLIDLVPERIADHPAIVNFQKKYVAKEKTSGRDLAIFCGSSSEPWSPMSLERGIGGSEEAVIHLAKHLKEEGWNVVVYNNCGNEEGEHAGVQYLPFWYFNPKDNFDVFVSWRLPQVFQWDIQAKKRYLWMHDVPSIGEFSKERLARMDKIIVLSEYHKSLFIKTGIPDEKFMISRNGVDVGNVKPEKRIPTRAIYTSSPDRGLEQMLSVWPEIKAKVPEAELHVFYGWMTFEAANQNDPSLMKWKDDMMKKIKETKGIVYHGRVSHSELHQEFLKSGVFAYYCTFPEISCISAMKAQVLGCIPVTNTHAALAETVKQERFKVASTENPAKDTASIIEWRDAMIEALTTKEKIATKILTDFGWDGVAAQWTKEFLR